MHHLDYDASEALARATRANRFSPLVHRDARPHPMATRRTVGRHELRALRVRWLVIGMLAATVPLLIAMALVRVFGGAA